MVAVVAGGIVVFLARITAHEKCKASNNKKSQEPSHSRGSESTSSELLNLVLQYPTFNLKV